MAGRKFAVGAAAEFKRFYTEGREERRRKIGERRGERLKVDS
jgi:hypothetical protein